MSVSKTLLAIDILTTSLNTAARVSTLLQSAQSENRDITDEELATIRGEADDLEREILNT